VTSMHVPILVVRIPAGARHDTYYCVVQNERFTTEGKGLALLSSKDTTEGRNHISSWNPNHSFRAIEQAEQAR
jgi:hypothetical protein